MTPDRLNQVLEAAQLPMDELLVSTAVAAIVGMREAFLSAATIQGLGATMTFDQIIRLLEAIEAETREALAAKLAVPTPESLRV